MLRHRLPLLLLLLPSIAAAELQISDAWIKNLPPTVPVRAGYLTVYNPQDQAVVIVAIHSEKFGSIEIHRTMEKDGLMSMEPVAEIRIDAGSSVQLAPGGLHLMMMHPADPTKPGDIIEITLQLEDGSEQVLQMTVKE